MSLAKLMVRVFLATTAYPPSPYNPHWKSKANCTCGSMRELLMYIIGLQCEYYPIHPSSFPQFTKSLAEVKGFNASFL